MKLGLAKNGLVRSIAVRGATAGKFGSTTDKALSKVDFLSALPYFLAYFLAPFRPGLMRIKLLTLFPWIAGCLWFGSIRIEALIASAAGTRGELKEAMTRPDLIGQVVDGYEKVLPRLLRHAQGWPTADELRRCIKSGNRNPHALMKEGDTPAWFFFLKRGGNDPTDPSQPGWGGQFQRADDGWYVDLPATDDFDPRTTVSRWRDAFQRDFATRLSWCVER
jgi:hypothetical protein